jgi:cleavage and polyadenylation specificity factor subunit 3
MDTEVLSITPLGGGQEVGRSCILLELKERVVLLDCGIHPGREGEDSLPFFDTHDPSTVDIILITHFHLDHCASLPYYTEKTNFNGRIFMTHATKAVMKLLLTDNCRLQSNPLYTEHELMACVDKVEVVDFYHTIEHKGIRFTASPAGHVLGTYYYYTLT